VARLFLLFTVVPLVELYLLIAVGRFLGAAPTILLVLVTGALGAWFARLEGVRVLRRWQESLRQQQIPKDGVIDGLLIFLGGVMLITPGILTDLLGLSMVVPLSRRVIAGFVRNWFDRQMRAGRVQFYATQQAPAPRPRGEVIEVEGEVVEVVEAPRPPFEAR